jgi:hypothetical protein
MYLYCGGGFEETMYRMRIRRLSRAITDTVVLHVQ